MRFVLRACNRSARAILIVTVLLGIGFAFGACSRQAEPPREVSGDTVAPEENGIYAVLREAPTPEGAQGAEPGCPVLSYDRKYTDAGTDEPVTYVAIDASSFAPLILEGAPDATDDGGGKTILSVTLKREYVKPLEDFTRTHLDGKVAVLIGGEIVTLHKIRSVISGGQLQVTRCTDNACEILRAKLTE